LWSTWHHRAAPYNKTEIQAVDEDAGRHLGYIRLVAQRMPGIKLEEYAWPDALKSMLKGIPPTGQQATGETPARARCD
jgi:hypothetical protein